MTTQLDIYNAALGFLGERSLATLSDSTESRRTLDTYWTQVRDYCLGQGHWKFAKRRVKIDPSITEIPTFGYRRAFDKPTDFIRLSELASDEYFNSPLSQFDERGAFWYADIESIYVGYVSKDASFGYNIDLWPETFTFYLELQLAVLTAARLAPELKRETIEENAGMGLDGAKKNALSKDAVQGPTQFLPPGRWSSARRNRSSPRNSRISLYGS